MAIAKRQVTRIETDESLHSLLPYGSPEFPFAYYDDSIMEYEGRTIGWHRHEAFECSLIEEGPVHCRVFRHHYVLDQGDMVFLNSQAVHSFSGSRGGRIKNIIFGPEFLSPSSGSVYREYVEPVLNSSLTHFALYKNAASNAGILQEMRQCCLDAEQDRDGLQMLKLQSDVNRLWQELFPRIMADPSGNTSSHAGTLPKRVQNRGHLILDYLHAHYGERIKVDDIARAVHISRREVLRCFSACFGTTPISYLNEYRVLQAQELLSQSDLSVTETALTCGFDNPGYFCKVFREKTGTTPLRFRAGG